MMRGMSEAEMLGLTSFLTGGLALAADPRHRKRVRPPCNTGHPTSRVGRKVQYSNGAELLETYPLSIRRRPGRQRHAHQLLRQIGFGSSDAGGRVPHLQRPRVTGAGRAQRSRTERGLADKAA